MKRYSFVTNFLFIIQLLFVATDSFQPSASSFGKPRTHVASSSVEKTLCSFVGMNSHHQSFISLTRQASMMDQDNMNTRNVINSNETNQDKNDNDESKKIGKTIFLLPNNANNIISKFGSYSPIGSPFILQATQHIAKKINWCSDCKVDTEIIVLPSDDFNDFDEEMKQKLMDANALIAMNIVNDQELDFISHIFDIRRSSGKKNTCQFAIDCNNNNNNDNNTPEPNGNKPSSSISTNAIVGPYDKSSPSLSSLFPWTDDASGKRMVDQMMNLFHRWTTDDYVIAILIFFNQYCESVDWVKYSIDATWEKGPIQNSIEFYNMITKCGDCITKCIGDEKCKECLDELTKIDTRDQVASYRTIVSYESELLKDFSFCILQKNNIFNCNAKIPTLPNVEPMKMYRGQELTKEMAKRILVGHLDDPIALEESAKSDISWKVAAGANVAYDQFPSQNQIFYQASNGRDMWYDPVFRVETIDGRNVWCKRHYRVREEKEVGTFRFSVLDNGVTSNEFWSIVAVADDLSWIIFHYAGAASSVGQRYVQYGI